MLCHKSHNYVCPLADSIHVLKCNASCAVCDTSVRVCRRAWEYSVPGVKHGPVLKVAVMMYQKHVSVLGLSVTDERPL